MARRRRKRSSAKRDDAARAPKEAIEAEAKAESVAPSPSPSPAPASEPDELCLIHATRKIADHCAICASPLCLMCTFDVDHKTLCNHCFEDRIAAGDFSRGGWQGWAGLALGLCAVAAVLGSFSFAGDKALLDLLPKGRAFFAYAATLTGAAGLILGFAAQDVDGLSKRAGMVGAVFCLIVLVAVVTLNLVSVIGAG